MNEQWKPIEEFPQYEVSDRGRIRNRNTDTIRNLYTNPYGYKQITFHLSGKWYCYTIHRLVALAFIGNPPPDRQEVNHINGDKTDNCVENLEWCNRSHNVRHAWAMGAIVGSINQPAGEDHRRSKLTNQDVFEMRQLHKEGVSIRQIAKGFPVTENQVGKIVKGKAWQHLLGDE